jgi:hypothetical protein
MPRLEAPSISMTSRSSPGRIASPIASASPSVVAHVERLGEDAGHRRLAHASRAAEEVRVGRPLSRDRVLQRPRDGLLPDDLIEVAGAVSPGENGVGHDGGLRLGALRDEEKPMDMETVRTLPARTTPLMAAAVKP